MFFFSETIFSSWGLRAHKGGAPCDLFLGRRHEPLRSDDFQEDQDYEAEEKEDFAYFL